MKYRISSEEDFLKRLGEYVSLETPSADAKQIDRINRMMEEDFRNAVPGGDLSISREGTTGGDILIARMPAEKKPHQILLLGHRDTVFPMGTYEKNPYREEAEVLRGPGVLDMKTGDLFAVEIFRHFSGRMPEDWGIVGVFNGDEETGSHLSEETIRQIAKESDFCLCLEPSIPGHCTIGRKGLAGYELTVTGIAAHSGTNYQAGASAIQALSRAISEIYALRDDEKSLSINIGAIRAEGKANIVCPWAWATGEARCFDPVLLQETLKKIESICEENPVLNTKIALKIRGIRPPMVQSEEGRRLFDLAKEKAAEHGLSLEGRIHGGGSDGSFVSDEGIPVLDGMGAEGENAHTFDEYVVKSSIMNRLKTCIDIIEAEVERE
ncbi:MAG: M20/M25/M40 family metallo-hydrolase [Firmicutes bacterium]|nr:M20/M25/M40 family metallo-hydrolase [Bacillota bacterium]